MAKKPGLPQSDFCRECKSYQQVCYKSHLGNRIKRIFNWQHVCVSPILLYPTLRRLKWKIKNSLDNLDRRNSNLKPAVDSWKKNSDVYNIKYMDLNNLNTQFHLYLQIILSTYLKEISNFLLSFICLTQLIVRELTESKSSKDTIHQSETLI